MEQRAISKYLEQLSEVKKRGKVYRSYAGAQGPDLDEWLRLEVATQQLKATLDLIAFGFVLATGESAMRPYVEFLRYRDPEKFLERLSELNSGFYPQPIEEYRREDGTMEWRERSGHLQRAEFGELYRHCESILWPREISRQRISAPQLAESNRQWYSKLVRLLNVHLVHPRGSARSWLFHMNVEDAEPRCTPFELQGEVAETPVGARTADSRGLSPVDHFMRQLDFLRRSCTLFDDGHFEEALRIAVTIRVLFHDTRSSVSLFRQLRRKDTVRLATTFGIKTRMPGGFEPTLILPLFAASAETGTRVPFDLPEPVPYLTVKEWWEEIVWLQGASLSRAAIVLAAANKEGGAHVDPAVPEFVNELRAGMTKVTSLKVNGVEVGTPQNFHFYLLRQFAHELLSSPDFIACAER